MARPLQIYLDNSDFSNLSSTEKGIPEQREVEKFLVTMQSKGKIQLRYSEAHILEAAPITQEAIPAASARLRTIKRLCGKNCLISPIDLIARELRCVSEGRKTSLEGVLRNDGRWFSKILKEPKTTPSTEKLHSDDIVKIGRKERRKQLRNGGKLQNELDNDATAFLVDLNQFAGLFSKDWNEAVYLANFFRKHGAEFKELLVTERQQYVALAEASKIGGVDSEKLARIIRDTFNEELSASSGQIAKSLAGTFELAEDSINITDPWSEIPGLTTTTMLTLHIARSSIAGPAPRAQKPGDFGDIYHSIYLPYVDIFRTDKDAADMIQKFAPPIKTTIVNRFLDLPSRIENALSARNAKAIID